MHLELSQILPYLFLPLAGSNFIQGTNKQKDYFVSIAVL